MIQNHKVNGIKGCNEIVNKRVRKRERKKRLEIREIDCVLLFEVCRGCKTQTTDIFIYINK